MKVKADKQEEVFQEFLVLTQLHKETLSQFVVVAEEVQKVELEVAEAVVSINQD